MNKRSIPIAIVSCILAVAGLAGYFLVPAASTEANPTRLLMENIGGRVVFAHKAHSTPGGAYGDVSCATCHHELKVQPDKGAGADGKEPSVMACASCHGTADIEGYAQSHQELYRAKGGDAACASCHHTTGVDGFSDKWNHQDHWDFVGDCATCHHGDAFEYKPGKFMNIKPQKCSNCHTEKPNPLTSTTRKQAGHNRCESCHSDFFSGKATDCAQCHTMGSTAQKVAKGGFDGKYSSCASCHSPISGAMDAYHNNCGGCHKTMQKGPLIDRPCETCHAK
ncbi:hypothetical protein LJC59_03205 [Desulfovibrio sp. OttesenSCG-928-A18]|nr:hypothetical protein [Desulfovibrio sp. OttesenSCG-928-A18]